MRERLIIKLILIFTAVTAVLAVFNLFTQVKMKYSHTNSPSILKGITGGAALLKIEGEIHSGKSTYQSTGADTVLAKLREYGKSDEIKGILIEINSPGGTVAASQEIYDELMHLRKTKKIVVSMKDMAASGGYYIAAAADFIYAESGTITGSIGVIAVSPDISGLLKKYSVDMRVYKEGKYKDILSMFKKATPEEENIIHSLLSDTYTRFISDIAEGRNMKVSIIEKLAEGRIYSGTAAKKAKLVDEIGGRREAMAKLSELTGSSGTLELMEEEENPFDRFFGILGSKMNTFFGGMDERSIISHKLTSSPVLIMLPSAIRL